MPSAGSDDFLLIDERLAESCGGLSQALRDQPSVVLLQPLACVTDEGFGRFASCDQNGY